MAEQPAMAALEFCALVRGKEDTPGGRSAFSILNDRERADLDALLGRYAVAGGTAEMERRARVFLTGYRERATHGGVLDQQERRQLDAILDQHAAPRRRAPHRPRWAAPAFAAAMVAAATVVTIAVIPVLHGQHLGSSPHAGPVNQHPPVRQVPPAPTGLQQTEALLGPWQTITPSVQRPQTGAPAVLLLSAGNTEASQKWTVPATGGSWALDQSGSVGDVTMRGATADITDADGTSYVVGTGQVFVFASNPDVVFAIRPDGTPATEPLATAVATRQHLGSR